MNLECSHGLHGSYFWNRVLGLAWISSRGGSHFNLISFSRLLSMFSCEHRLLPVYVPSRSQRSHASSSQDSNLEDCPKHSVLVHGQDCRSNPPACLGPCRASQPREWEVHTKCQRTGATVPIFTRCPFLSSIDDKSIESHSSVPPKLDIIWTTVPS